MPLKGTYEPGADPAWEHSNKQVELYERSGGREGTTLGGLPVVVVTSVGVRSGRLRKTPLMRVEHDGEYALVASKGGAARHPAWYYNVAANPHVELQDGPVKHDYTAREVVGEERARWWRRAVEAFPPYADYAARTDRRIPVFVLTRR